MPAVHFLLLSGGTGSRMGAGRPKQFLQLGNRPVLRHSLDTFLAWTPKDPSVQRALCVVVAPVDHRDETTHLLAQIAGLRVILSEPDSGEATGRVAEKSESVARIVDGGADRHQSTLRGLRALAPNMSDGDAVFIHDAARPLIEAGELDALSRAVFADGSCGIASLAGPVTETIVKGKSLPGAFEHSVDRGEYFAIKTPQALSTAVLRRLEAITGNFTDLLTWGEAAGICGELVPAGPRNIKLTHAADLPYLESLLGRND